MEFYKIDLECWERKPYFEYYMNHMKCSYSMTVNIDITVLLPFVKAKSLKFYPVFLYMVASAVNAQREFRTCFNADKELGYWDKMNPAYTIFHEDTKTFASSWIEYSNVFVEFYQRFQVDMERQLSSRELQAKPDNCFPVSCIPWVSFTSFNVNLFSDSEFLLPIITSGKYFEQGNTVQLPIAIQIHHAVADGYHTAQFMNHIQRLASTPETWERA